MDLIIMLGFVGIIIVLITMIYLSWNKIKQPGHLETIINGEANHEHDIILDSTSANENVVIYERKQLMTPCEYQFYNTLKELEQQYRIIPQLNLASIIKKVSEGRYHNELFRNIDFAIFNYDYSKVLLLIELNDKSHEQISRRDRDLKVKKICNDAGIPIMQFHTYYPNERDYVLPRILNVIEKTE